MKSSVLLIVFFLVCILNNLQAQTFTQISGLSGELTYSEVNETYSVAFIGGDNNYKSIDNGVTWTEFDNSVGSTLNGHTGHDIVALSNTTYCMIIHNSSNNNYSVARTTDGGLNWTLTLTVSGFEMLTDIQANGNIVMATTRNGVQRSTNGGLTWSFVTLSSGYEYSEFIDYNSGSSTWFVGSYSSDFMVSIDQGATWTVHPLGIPSLEIVSSSNVNNQLLFVREVTGNDNELITVDPTNGIGDTLDIPSQLLATWYHIDEAAYLPNGNIIATNGSRFYVVDTASWNVYFITTPYHGWNFDGDLSLGQTFGIGTSIHNSSGTSYAYLIDYGTPAPLAVSGNFFIQDPNATCAGDDIVAIPYVDYMDSIEWFVNNTVVSTDSILSYPTSPGAFVSYVVDVNIYYDGNMEYYTQTITLDPPQPPHSFAYTVDTTACYGNPLQVFINPDNGSPSNTWVSLYYGGQLHDGPWPMSQMNMYLNTDTLIQEDTLLIISYNNGACDNTSDTIMHTIELGPDLLDFTTLALPTDICGDMESVDFNLVGTESAYNYEFSNTVTFLSGTDNFGTMSGSTGDTITATLLGYQSHNSALFDVFSPAYISPSVTVTNVDGCSQDLYYDSIRIHNPDAVFNISSHSNYLTDTVAVSNAHIVDNRIWEMSTNPGNPVSGFTDTIPVVIANSKGFYPLQLKNEPLLGCKDSVTQTIHFCNVADTIQLPQCFTADLPKVQTVHKFKRDKFGNLYVIGTNRLGFHGSIYTLDKYDSLGALVWHIEPNVTLSTVNFGGALIEDIEFDLHGNVYLAFGITGHANLNSDYFTYSSNSSNSGVNYLVKIDGDDASHIWTVNTAVLSNLSGYPARITDVVIQDSLVHFSQVKNGTIFEFGTLDLDGDYINSIDFWNGAIFNYVKSNHHIYTGSLGGNESSYFSPQLVPLPNGKVMAVGYGSGQSSYPEFSSDSDSSVMFALQYDYAMGTVGDFKRIADLGILQGSYFLSFYGGGQEGFPHVAETKEGNVVIALHWDNADIDNTFSYQQNTSIKILDSIIPLKAGTALFEIDSLYNLNWLTLGTHSRVDNLSVSSETGEIFIASKAKDNLSFGQDTTHIMSGEYGNHTFTYNSTNDIYSFPSYLHTRKAEVFISQFSKAGTPTAMLNFHDTSTIDAGNYIRTFVSATPCGDMDVLLQNTTSTGNPLQIPSYTINGTTTSLDSTLLIHYQWDCIDNSCKWIDLEDSVEHCSVGDTVFIDILDYYLIDHLDYFFEENGSQVGPNYSIQFDSTQLDLFVPGAFSTDFEIIFTYPQLDTVYVTNLSIPMPSYSYADTVCYGDQLLITASPSNLNYDWLGNTYNGNTLALNQNQYSPGINSITVESHQVPGCIGYDTLEIFVEELNLNLSASSEGCENDSIILTGSPSLYDYSWLSGTENGDSLVLPPFTYSSGSHIIDLVVTSTFGCQEVDSIQLVVNPVPTPIFTFNDTICDGLTGNINSSAGYTYYWLNNTASGSNLTLSPADYVVGLNEIDVITESNDLCYTYDTLQLFVLDCADLFEISGLEIIISPNPANDFVLIEHANIIGTYKLLDITGKQILDNPLDNHSTTVKVSHLTRGIYYLIIQTNGQWISHKLLLD